MLLRSIFCWIAVVCCVPTALVGAVPIDGSTLHHKIMCGYQGWFRCPGDAANQGWDHWSRNRGQITPDTIPFEMWPDMRHYSPGERYPAPGFTYPNGKQAYLFSSDNPATVLRHFRWMQHYEIDGAWMQLFVVGLPGGPLQTFYPSRHRVLEDAASAADKTGRVWAISYDIAAMPADRIYDVLTRNWESLVREGLVKRRQYLRQDGLPVVQIWGFYANNRSNQMTAALANRLIDYFRRPGPNAAFLVGGGDWDWHRNPDPQWQAFYRRFRAYATWNVGNTTVDSGGVRRASTQTWAEDQSELKQQGALWIPVVYPGFNWDNLQRLPPGTSDIPRRRGAFLWEQFYQLAKLGVDTVYIAMFDEVDEGTAIFEVTNSPPVQAHFVGYEGLPSNWYLRLVRRGIRMIRGQERVTAALPRRP